MSVTALAPNPTIKIFFSGLTISHIRDGAPVAQIGAIRDTGCHHPKIKVIKQAADGTQRDVALVDDFDLDEDIFLDVEDAAVSSIQTLEVEGFDRDSDDARFKQDFRLFVDFERDIFKNTEIEIDQSKIQPVFHLQGAVFHTEIRTKTRLDLEKRVGGALTPLGGFAAESISAEITLDKLTSKAVLRSGNRVIRTIDACDVAKKVSYLIEFNCECDQNEVRPATALFGQDASDFLLVYKALGTNLTNEQQVDLKGRTINLAGGGTESPEVICSGPNAGKPLRP